MERVSNITSHERPANNNYFPALDGLRAVAFLMVFFTHYTGLPWGFTGVNAFFVLSGFLITGILLDTRDEPRRVYNFYVRRTLRIFPLYYGVILLVVLSYPLLHWRWNWYWLVWPAYLGNFAWFCYPFLHGPQLAMLADAQPFSETHQGVRLFFGHFWSLCVEEQFYLFWPWIVFSIKDRVKLIRICVAFLIICPLLRVIGDATFPPLLSDARMTAKATPLCIDALLLGGFIALGRRGGLARPMLAAARFCFPLLSGAIILWLVAYVLSPTRPASYIYPSWAFTWGLSLADFLSACVMLMALEPGTLTFRILNLSPLRWLGRISYGAYVFHDIFHPQYSRLAGRYLHDLTYAPAVIGLPCTVLLAWASFRWFEQPFIRLKQRWTRGSRLSDQPKAALHESVAISKS